MKYFITAILIFYSLLASAVYVKGVVRDNNGDPLPYASVYVKNSTYGTTTNFKGEYFLELKPGSYLLVFSFIGYETIEKNISLSAKSIIIDVKMKAAASLIKEVEVYANTRDKAKEVMDSVREKRKYYLNSVESYSCKTYIKTSIEKESADINLVDSLKLDTVKAKDIKAHFKKEKLNMIESISNTYFKEPGKYKEVVTAHHDYAEVKGESLEKSVSLSIEFEEPEIIPKTNFEDNPYILYNGVSSVDLNFYRPLIDFPILAQKPFLSPLAPNSGLSYKFNYVCAFYEDEKKIHKIEIIPRIKTETLFSGIIYIEDSTWALVSLDLNVNKAAMNFCRDFNIIQNYQKFSDSVYLPVRRELIYTIREGKDNILGNTRVDHSEYKPNIEFEGNFFTSEIKTFDANAFDKDSNFWQNERPITLKDTELEFIRKTDSIKAYYTSEEYFRKVDSAFNRVDWWFWLAGIGHKNHLRGTEWYISGLIEQISPLGIGGYRHKLPGYFNKEFKNDYLLETKGFVDYGFRNEDIKGKLSVGLTYIPKKFVRTMITVGDYYDMINNYAAVSQMFSMSNYVRTKTFEIAQRMEIVNGLFGELTFIYSDQIPIANLQMSQWSEALFGELNDAGEFERYMKTEIKLELKYRFKQEYIIKGNKKYIIGTDYPELQMVYRKGIPGLLNSEVNFDFIEFGMKDELQLGRFGKSAYNVYTGGFFNSADLRVLEHKYFRGSDPFFFSDPMRSFQLMEAIKHTPGAYIRANYMHHFEGNLLNMVPLLNKLNLSLAGGAGTLIIRDEDFAHFEMFAGIEKTIRIKKQLFRIGIFAVTADDSLDKANFTFKLGINTYNTFLNKWDY
ncbi:MAG: hypothetical protein A2W91_11345 [Bacteroidetes bacterium GWF2_38_335]|nr:MAG: hypothetical protein A2W91_11345 [Bacteroidetes bacterium GWF2_38_335]OFY81708.1 MAG: hypothetical protein A2281_05695 [Bacteroidetes bacterium RIFOXYA12_FULL_38_20]HBS87772.1 hypothetical protein [Bacteroidales bacterium]